MIDHGVAYLVYKEIQNKEITVSSIKVVQHLSSREVFHSSGGSHLTQDNCSPWHESQLNQSTLSLATNFTNIQTMTHRMGQTITAVG